jgi:para-nitrobenzyl esterase
VNPVAIAGNGLTFLNQGIQNGQMWWLPYGPNIDNYVFTGDPYTLMGQGKFHKVPLIVGSNSDEAALIFPPPSGSDPVSYYSDINGVAGTFAVDAQTMYPYFNPLHLPRGHEAVVAFGTDIMFACDARRVARNAVRGGAPVVYRYLWTHGFRWPNIFSNWGAAHIVEVPFIFNTTSTLLGIPFYNADPDELLLGQRARAYWSTLISGTPTANGAFAWPVYGLNSEDVLVLDTTMSTQSKYRDSYCNYWDSALNMH